MSAYIYRRFHDASIWATQNSRNLRAWLSLVRVMHLDSGKKSRTMAITTVFVHSMHLETALRRLLPASKRDAALTLGVALLFTVGNMAQAQTASTAVIPTTIATVVGSSPTATTAGTACPTNLQFTATDTVGDGCPAVNATLATPSNIVVDPAGNLYISTSGTSVPAVRRVDARTGIITSFTSTSSSQCVGSGGVKIYGTTAVQVDKTGDGCPVGYASSFNTVSNLGRDPYGNILLGSKDVIIHMACNAVSPICTASQAGENIMVAVAGCTDAKTTSFGTAVVGITPGTAGDGTAALQTASGTCTVGIGTVVYGITADKWDNVYFMDGSNGRIRVVAGAPSVTVSGTTYTNPLYATLATSTGTGINYSSGGTSPLGVHQGYIYPIAGGGTVCSGNTDAYGDGCPFYQTTVYTSSTGADVQGLTTDLEGDLIFADGQGDLRVIYMGGQLIKGALSANGVTTPVLGNSYRLLGGGTAYNYNSSSPGIKLGTTGGFQAHAIQTLTTDPAGNILIGDQEQIFFYDLATGYFRRLGTSSSTTSCNSTSRGDGCSLNPAGTASSTGAVFGAANGVLSLSEDSLGNLYVLDAAALQVRRVGAATLPSTPVNGSATTTLVVHAPSAGSSVALTAASSSEVSIGTPACVTNTGADNSVDCTAAVTYTPKLLTQRTDPLSIATTVGGTTTTQSLPVNGLSTGSALVFDTANAPVVATLGAATTGNTAVLLDGDGNAYVYGAQGISKVNSAGTVNITSGTAAYMAVDPAGNVYAANAAATSITEYAYSAAAGTYSSGVTVNLPSLSFCTGTISPAAYSCAAAAQTRTGPFVVDVQGVLYVADTTNKQLYKFTPATGLVQQLTQTALTSPTQMSQDAYGDLLVLDGTSILKIPPSGFAVGPTSPFANPTVNFSPALSAPTGVAADQGGNFYVADSGSIRIATVSGGNYTLPNASSISLSTPTAASAGTASTIMLTPTNSADTLAGTLSITVGSGSVHSLTVANGTTLSALASQINADSTFIGESVAAAANSGALTISGPATAGTTLSTTGTSLTDTAYTSGTTALAVDGAGNLYAVQTAVAGITEILRNSTAFNFGTNQTTTFVGVLSNAGVTPGTGFGQSDTNGDFSVAAPATPLAPSAAVCNLLATSIPAGTACNGSFTFTPSANGSGVITNTLTLATAGVTNTIGSLALTGTKTGANATTSTSVTGNTSGLVYAPGTETTFTVTVSETPAAAPTGSVSVYFDGSITPVSYPLTALNGSSSTATVTISGASAGSHSISATFASSAGITGSSSALTSYSIAQAPTSVTWNPSATTLQYSAAIGTGILDATANVPGAFVYTATSGSASTNIHSASYLPIGSYNLSVAFIPTDSVDYAAPSTTPTATLSVTQASTTAAIGATQTLVASDGTGNYTTVQAAVNALPSGGSIYIKPGTYNGFVTVVQPNISLRGLGGDPTKVVLTHAAGAFGSSYPYTGEFTAANSNGAQLNAGSSLFTGDEGSATIVVARGINTAIGSTQLIPNGFYAENLSFINSYNTDTTTTTTYESTANGTCVAGQPTAMTYTALYNAGTQCASQALAIWMTSDLAVINNVYFASLQDTVYTASPGSQVPSRQYWFRGKIAGAVDYIFGDAAAVFDSTTIYSAFHGTAATGTVTIHAQNQSQPTPAYLSGYILNNAVLTSQAPGMTNLYFGRPYGTYSTWVMLNSYVDQVNPGGYTTGLGPSLTSTTFLEYNDIPYTDPATNGVDINGVAYVGTGGNSGSGVTGARENVSTNPGTPEAGNNPPVTMTMAQAQAFFPTNFLGRTVSSSTTTNWNPTAALAANVNSFVPSGSATTITAGQSITLLMRPQTPGLGVIPAASYSAASPTAAVFTAPTGTYSLSDTTGGNTTVIASGNLDAAGEAYYVSAASAALAPGVHSLKWTYSGDSNFTGSTSSAYTLTVNAPAVATSTVVSANANPATYGQASTVTATVLASGNPATSGTVSLTVDGAAFGSAQALNASGQAVFSLGTLSVATHTIVANYSGATGTSASYNASSGNLSLVVQQATLTILGTCTNRAFYTANSCSVSVTGYATGDSASTVFSMAPVATTSAVKSSPAGSYPTSAAYTLTTAGSTNYTVVNTPGSFTITGGGNAAQSILFAPLPNLPSGTWQLSARSTSGLPVTYTVTGAGASISGKTLVLSGATGNVIQVTATQTDPSGDYATASATRSFTAQ
jgi:pectin methylesterase-like acyl-CoA thioesterase